MPRYLSLFKYNAEGRKGLMKEKAAATGQLREANAAVSILENSLMLAAALRLLD
jgi:hypothetical protein